MPCRGASIICITARRAISLSRHGITPQSYAPLPSATKRRPPPHPTGSSTTSSSSRARRSRDDSSRANADFRQNGSRETATAGRTAAIFCTAHAISRLPAGRRYVKLPLAGFTAADGMQIDCDIHPGLEGTRTTLLPYLDDHWREQVTSRGIDGLDLTSYPPNMPLSC